MKRPPLRSGFMDRLGRLYDYLTSGPARLISSAFALIGSPTFHLCGEHWCMDGHMRHPPYALGDYLGDLLWTASFFIAAVCAIFSPERRYWLISLLIILTLCMRNFLGGEVIALVLLDVVALVGLVRAILD
jgi:hypothetical protein